MSENLFVLPTPQYQRDIKFLQTYIHDTSTYLAEMTGDSYETCRDFMKAQLGKGGMFPFTDPKVEFLHRPEYEDRFLEETTLYQYIQSSVSNNESIAPSFTTYVSPDDKNSLLSMSIDKQIKVRSVKKKEMFQARMRNDHVTALFKNLEQGNAKIKNNALSGASLTASTPLYNPTSHSTLTLNCRTTTAYANANNEKFIEGNRHYYNVDVILNNLVSIGNLTDLQKVEETIRQYGLAYPTVDDVINVIRRGAQFYFVGEKYLEEVIPYIEKLSPLKRAAFVYIGDFYHLKMLNPQMVRDFLVKMIYIPSQPHPNPDEVFKNCQEDNRILATQICKQYTKGIEFGKLKEKNYEYYGIVAACVENIQLTLSEHRGIIENFWITRNVPASVAFFPSSIRRSVLGGDTDSTLFTVQSWVQDHFGRIGFSYEMTALSDVIIFFAAQTVKHLLARMAANFGIHPDRMFDIEMKNEYKFDNFTPTSRSKHYFAYASAQEGNVYEKFDIEMKGVGLIGSNTPPSVNKLAKDTIIEVMDAVVQEKDIYLYDILRKFAQSEKEIFDTINNGGSQYFRTHQIKPAAAYKDENPDRTPYWNYTFWEKTFAAKYGSITEPPYTALKVSVDLESPTSLRKWLAGLDDQTLAENIARELARIGRKGITTFYIPLPIIEMHGIPKEILQGINVRKIVKDITSVYYLVLESFGVFMTNNGITRLISDEIEL